MKITRNSLFTLFALLFSVNALFAQDPIPISEAREKTEGTTVTVTGHVTVTDEFSGPVYFQDETGAIAWFDYGNMREEFTLDVQCGDSIVVTGEIGFFNDLLQVVDATSWEFFPDSTHRTTPVEITVEEMNSGDFESQLVSMNVDIDHTGSLQGNTNYDISDNTGTGELRIDRFTNLVGAEAPEGVTTIVGIVGRYQDTFQLLPRDTEDLNADPFEYPGEEISKDQTFEVATWNIEWFGSASNGPDDEAEQMANVGTVIAEVDADLYAFQEISNTADFADLIAGLDGYGGFVADFSQTQKTAFVFKRATIDSLDSGMITSGMTQSNWANGRYPLFFRFNATVEGETREIYAFNIHAKAFDDFNSYDQRENASAEIKQYLDSERAADNVIFLGDYNDTIEGSITSGQDSPYDNFDQDEEYTIITKSLEERGFASQASGSFIDHITITSELADEYIVATERVENTTYIGSYLSSTSDHYPIWTRFQFTTLVSNEDELSEQPVGFSLDQNYPNPFNPTTQISYRLSESGFVQLEVFDVMGRKVATLVSENQSAGQKTATFDASNLSSGVYIYRLSTATGQQLTKKMMLIK
ncbi:T9SS type A sorting domain-containing protein [Gracilimonas sp. BCB1]|uniref:T9SS type A sorting domain-containing protein n=1 Tax=Gracilimonas sp. BCB1 TaxID=3152362 RepID=UPI0032D8CBCF